MASLSLYLQFETNLMSNCKVSKLLLQLKSARAHGKNYIKVKPHMAAIFSVIVNCSYLRVGSFLGHPVDILVFEWFWSWDQTGERSGPKWTIPLEIGGQPTQKLLP